MDKLNITHLVLSGGGMRGVIYIGAIRYLYIENLHQKITHIAANSIGSFVALCITFKLTIEEIEEIIWEDLMPECIWKFRVKKLGPLFVTMDSHGQSQYKDVMDAASSNLKNYLSTLGY